MDLISFCIDFALSGLNELFVFVKKDLAARRTKS